MNEYEQADVVRAGRLEVVDEPGRARVVVGALRESRLGERFGVEVRDEAGRARVWLVLEPEGPALVFDHGGNLAIHAGTTDPIDDGVDVGTFLYLYDHRGVPVVGWEVEADGTVTEHR